MDITKNSYWCCAEDFGSHDPTCPNAAPECHAPVGLDPLGLSIIPEKELDKVQVDL